MDVEERVVKLPQKSAWASASVEQRIMQNRVQGTCALVVLAFLLCISNAQTSSAAITTTKTSRKTYTDYLKTACNSTTYPQLCFKSLYSYSSTIKTNDLKLCNAALTVSLEAARNTSKLVKSLSKRRGLSKIEAAVIEDCVEQITDSIDEIKQSLKVLGSLSGSDKQIQIDNIKTWVSAAITDQNTCTDGFDGRKISHAVKSTISKSIVNVGRLTSNALALINKLSY
ncbi:unnamed protein product [Dovyalis caffra]|uniref:Pectinesterase inhibitor domain-containing protein n=1 Tax=Dovyalis caffra TaxID=77055 RepID=A0AAV1RNP5_9ROSI|nr:unnamed protein product [Dovyalis caffra]